MNVQNPKDWDQYWQKAKENSPFTGRKDLQDVLNHWEEKALPYSQNVLGKKGEKRLQKVLSFLRGEGLDLTGMRILDIGAGPGAFTLPLAKKASEVVAVEPVKGMVSLLKKMIKEENLKNVKVVEKAWEEVDLKKEGFEGAFHLVFASMSPGINSLETVKKALLAGREYCFFSSYAGKRTYSALEQLWPLIFQEGIPPWPGDLFFLLNLLYTLGNELSCKIWEEKKKEEWDRERAIKEILYLLPLNNEEIGDLVRAYVEEHLENNTFSSIQTKRLGMILVRI